MRLFPRRKSWSARRLRLRAGDAVVIRLAVDCDRETLLAMRDDLARRFPDNQVLLLTKGTELSVDRADSGPTTADHLESVAEQIRQSGGPQNVRFAPVSTEMIGADPHGPVMVWARGREDALVDLVLMGREST